MYRQIIYTSHATSTEFDRGLPAILGAARRNNARAGVTGLLTLTGDTFVQLLEGAPDRVAPIFDAIRGDPRHAGLEVLIDRPAATRACSRWSMAYGTIETYPGGRASFLSRLRQFAAGETHAAQTVGVALVAHLDHAEVAGIA